MKKIHSLLILVLFVLSSCTNEDTDRGKSLINVYLIDAPGIYGQVWVELLGVEVQVSGTRGLDNADPVFLSYTPSDKQVNISSLIAGNQLLVGRGEFLVGTVTTLILKLGNNNYLIRNGQQIPLTFSGQESASPSVDVNFELEQGISHDYYLDFDVFRSVMNTGNQTYDLNPKLSAFNKQETGEISGTLRPQGLNGIIYAIQDLDTLTTGVDTVGGGDFVFQGVIGNYDLIIQPNIPDYLPYTLRGVTAQKGKVTRLGNITLERE